MDNVLEDWIVESQSFGKVNVILDDTQEKFKTYFPSSRVLLKEKLSQQNFSNIAFYEEESENNDST